MKATIEYYDMAPKPNGSGWKDSTYASRFCTSIDEVTHRVFKDVSKTAELTYDLFLAGICIEASSQTMGDVSFSKKIDVFNSIKRSIERYPEAEWNVYSLLEQRDNLEKTIKLLDKKIAEIRANYPEGDINENNKRFG